MIQVAQKSDLSTLAQVAALLWGSHRVDELEQEFAEIMDKGDSLFLLKIVQNEAVGFAQCQLRKDYVEGTSTSPVGYLEGVFVAQAYRNRGYAKELVAACENWAREMGCKEFASDCELHNTQSLAFHKALDFTEANRIICFAKKL